MSVSVHLKNGSGLSVRDKFGWLSIEGVDVPYILREAKEKFIPVRVVESSILAYYPSTYPKEVEQRPPLVCHYMKPDETALLNKCCQQHGASQTFTDTDPVVKLSDFLDFFGIVKQAYPHVVVGRKTPAKAVPDYGWILLRDALVPYVVRNGARMAPLNVIRGAAQLLIGVHVTSSCATEEEVACLNDMCRKVGLVFTFQSNTSLVDLVLVYQMCPGCPGQDLPKENPMNFVNGVGSSTDVASGHLPDVTSAGSSRKRGSPVGAGQSSKDQHPESMEQSAAKSLQALANMAKTQKTEQHGDDDCIVIAQAEEQAANNTEPTNKLTVKDGHGCQVARCHSNPNKTASVVASPKSREVAGDQNTTTSEIKTTKSSTAVIIKPMECFGKTISCLLRGKTCVAYALVEAVCRVYFPSCSLVDFIHFLELEMAVTLYVLKRSEEEAFIEFYGIPTKQLRCNQVIKLQDLRDRMGWLQSRFGPPKEQSPSASQSPNNGEYLQDSDLTESSTCSDQNVANEPQQNLINGECKNTTDDASSKKGRGKCGRNNSADDLEQQGKNKNLETTIMRILQDKREACENTEQLTVKESNNMADGHREIKPSGTEKNENGEQHKAPSSNKRKGAPPRKCLVPCEKKVTLLVDGVKVENPDMFTEESDMDDYIT